MPRTSPGIFAICLLVAAATAGAATAAAATAAAAAVAVDAARAASPATAALVQAGSYLAAAGDCVSCHTRPGGKAFAGGLALDTPFGVIYSANITPDAQTGIGRWSEQQFTRAMREGTSADGQRLYPAFPYSAYTKLSDQDVRALYAYLRSLQPVKDRPPVNQLRFPFGFRALLAPWNWLYFTPGRFVAAASRSAQWNRGAYLTEALGHCSACHSPRTWLGGERTALAYTGGEYLDEVRTEVVDGRITPLEERTVRLWSTANLTSAAEGIGAWSIDDIVDYLRRGHNARAAGFGPMGTVIRNSTRHLTDADTRAIAVYLKSLPAARQEPPLAARADQRRAGEVVYTARCGDCHQPTGLGTPRVAGQDSSRSAPPLAGSAVVQAPSAATLINVVLYGAHAGVDSEGAWPPMSGFELSVGLDDEQVAALCTYVRSSWGNRAGAVDASAVAQQR